MQIYLQTLEPSGITCVYNIYTIIHIFT